MFLLFLELKINSFIKNKKNFFRGLINKIFNLEEIAFIHIGKNAGSQVKQIAPKLIKQGFRIKAYKHNLKLHQLPKDSKYFFSIRNPSSRFVSGFYSRKRKGRPKFNIDWSPHEKIAFQDFEHANYLAENLFSNNELGISARLAIKSITHTGAHQFDYFHKAAYFAIQPPITIVRQEYFERDMQRFLDILGINIKIESLLTFDKIKSHQNDYAEAPPLSELALHNLKKWYIQDYMFYEMCEEWLKQNGHI